ncbi:MAG: hypothetical protein AAB336_14115 [Acidobacteriota bacterium]
MKIINNSVGFLILLMLAVSVISAQTESIGGKEHEMNIYGVTIGMDVPTALQTVFTSANRQPGQERPDGKRNEGKDNKDVRVVYKNLPLGELQIVFAQGKFVKEIILRYSETKRVTDLRLPNSSNIGEVTSGERFDDRYTIGFVDNKKQEKLWWRDAKTDKGYQTRLTFLSGNLTKDTTMWWQTIVQKAITVKNDDYEKFLKAISN